MLCEVSTGFFVLTATFLFWLGDLVFIGRLRRSVINTRILIYVNGVIVLLLILASVFGYVKVMRLSVIIVTHD